MLKHTGSLDTLAISTSAICAVHCLCLPLLLGVYPALGATVFGKEAFHVWLLWLVIPFSVISLLMGCKAHKDRWVAGLGLAGLATLIVTATLGHAGLGEAGERVATLIGASAIAASHMRNFMLCRRARAAHG